MEAKTINNRGESVIQPLLDKKTGKPLTNVAIFRAVDKILTGLKNSDKEEDQLTFSKMINGEPEIYDYIHEVASIKSDQEAQDRIKNTLLAIPGAAGK